MSTMWPRCPCGLTGWRYYQANGPSGWRCWCGAHRPDRVEAAPAAVVDVELPAGQLELFPVGSTE